MVSPISVEASRSQRLPAAYESCVTDQVTLAGRFSSLLRHPLPQRPDDFHAHPKLRIQPTSSRVSATRSDSRSRPPRSSAGRWLGCQPRSRAQAAVGPVEQQLDLDLTAAHDDERALDVFLDVEPERELIRVVSDRQRADPLDREHPHVATAMAVADQVEAAGRVPDVVRVDLKPIGRGPRGRDIPARCAGRRRPASGGRASPGEMCGPKRTERKSRICRTKSRPDGGKAVAALPSANSSIAWMLVPSSGRRRSRLSTRAISSVGAKPSTGSRWDPSTSFQRVRPSLLL